jgi:RNA polymerase sigma-70 factor (ECF subfamily)
MNDVLVDSGVIAACQEGDREAFRRLYDAFQSQVYSTAVYFMSGNTAAAEDITQDVFVRLFSRIRQFRNESAFSTWLHRMVVNACLDELRKRKRIVDGAEVERNTCSGPDFDDQITRTETVEEVQKALAGLSPKLRAPVLMKYFHDLSYEEMARALECSPGTVASRLNRGHKALAQKLAHMRDVLVSES